MTSQESGRKRQGKTAPERQEDKIMAAEEMRDFHTAMKTLKLVKILLTPTQSSVPVGTAAEHSRRG